jgi:hypothetical protein
MLQQRAIINTILRFFGLIPVAVIKEGETNIGAGSRRITKKGFKTDLKELFFILYSTV